MVVTIFPKKDDSSESKQRFEKFQGLPFINPITGQLFPNGKYYLDKSHTTIICIKDGYIDGRGNLGTGENGGWAIQQADGHTEYWKSGFPYRENYKGNEVPAIITDYGGWEEYWSNEHKLVKILMDELTYDNLV